MRLPEPGKKLTGEAEPAAVRDQVCPAGCAGAVCVLLAVGVPGRLVVGGGDVDGGRWVGLGADVGAVVTAVGDEVALGEVGVGVEEAGSALEEIGGTVTVCGLVLEVTGTGGRVVGLSAAPGTEHALTRTARADPTANFLPRPIVLPLIPIRAPAGRDRPTRDAMVPMGAMSMATTVSNSGRDRPGEFS